MGGASYAYDGEGRRVSQTVSSIVTRYLLDIQPGLAVVLSETTSANVTHYVHGPRGIHAQKDSGGNWDWMMQDGLGSVRAVADANADMLWSTHYDPYGVRFGSVGTAQTVYGFTGEETDGTGQVYLRARYYNPSVGVFASLDPFEGVAGRAMSLNGYSWVEGNVVNAGDSSGKCIDDSVCQELRRNGASIRQLLAAQCFNMQSVLSDQQGCCGPDATMWIHGEIQRHMDYASGDLQNELIDYIDLSLSDPRRIFINVQEFNNGVANYNNMILAIYGLAVDYANVNYQALSQAPISSFGCRSPHYITLCGRCHHGSDLGNFLLGVAIQSARKSLQLAELAGEVYRLIDVVRRGNPDSPTDSSAVPAGWHYAESGQFQRTFNRDQFCTFFNQPQTWYDTKRGETGCDHGYGANPCCGMPNLHSAKHSNPNYNAYISSDLNGENIHGGTTPKQELLSFIPIIGDLLAKVAQ